MGKNKNRKKKVNLKKERYAKFRKDKPSTVSSVTLELTPEQRKQAIEDDTNITSFLRSNKNPPTKEISKRKMASKR